MAQTGNNSSTSDDEWLLLRDILVLVTERCKPETVAAQLLLDYFAETGRPSRYWYQSVDHTVPDRGIHPSSWRGYAETRRWGFHVVVDWKNSSVAQFRAAPDPDDVNPETYLKVMGHLRESLPIEPIYQIRLVRLQRRVAFDALRWAGLLQPVRGALSVTQAANTVSAAGTVAIGAALSVTQAAQTLVAKGTITNATPSEPQAPEPAPLPAIAPVSAPAAETVAEPAAKSAVESPLAPDSLEQFVYEDMRTHRSELGDRGYSRRVHERALIVHPLGPGEEQEEEEARLKTIRNYVSTYRQELAPDTVQRRRKKVSKPAPASSQKLPTNFPKLPKLPGKS